MDNTGLTQIVKDIGGYGIEGSGIMAEDKRLNLEELGNAAGGKVFEESKDKICPKYKNVYFATHLKNSEVCGTKLLELPCTIVED